MNNCHETNFFDVTPFFQGKSVYLRFGSEDSDKEDPDKKDPNMEDPDKKDRSKTPTKI